MADELASYKLQLQQVQAALLGEPENEELIKLKEDLDEIIKLQEDLLGEEAAEATSSKAADTNHTQAERNYKVGDRVLAPSKNGQQYPAVIDGISGDNVAVTFVGNGRKDMVKRGELRDAPVEQKKQYVFDNDKGNKQWNKKNEWQAERERRKMRAQKKEVKKKELDQAKEGEKSKWHAFNSKAINKGFKGMKRVTATGSAADTASKRENIVSSRLNAHAFAKGQRGSMDTLF